MSLRCSVLGHAYGESEVERDREERGNEVIVTVQELRRCSRCDAETIVSENTEVRSVEPMPDLEPKSAVDRDAGSGTDLADEPSPVSGPPTDGAFGIDDEDDDPSTEDAVILDEEPASDRPERAPGEWPSADDTRFDEAGSRTNGDEADDDLGDEAADVSADAPVDSAARESDAADGSADDGVEVLEPTAGGAAADGSPSAGPADDRSTADEADGSETPAREDGSLVDGDADPASGPGAAPSTDDATSAGDDVSDGRLRPGDATGIVSAGPVESTLGDEVNVDAALVCPACGFSQAGYRSSNRAGDICPDCRRGYLAEQ